MRVIHVLIGHSGPLINKEKEKAPVKNGEEKVGKEGSGEKKTIGVKIQHDRDRNVGDVELDSNPIIPAPCMMGVN